jgi:carbon-monoxide dehydrogenase small subunit
MTIRFILNGEDVQIKTEADFRLIDILRTNFNLLQAKSGCLSGKCGCCSLIFNGKVRLACSIPAFLIRGSEIITLEGFNQTEEYQDIMQGFAKAKVETCGYCDAAKIFAIDAFLDIIPKPERSEAAAAFDGVICRCTEPSSLIDALLFTAEIRQRRLYGRATY